jgi:DNA (cytosine-5)-methyltransferase 1
VFIKEGSTNGEQNPSYKPKSTAAARVNISPNRPSSDIADEDLVYLKSKCRPNYEALASPVRIVDLFCGAGGLTLGASEFFRRLGRGIDVRLAVEFDKSIWPIYRKNFPQASDLSPTTVESWFDSPVGDNLSLAERRARKRSGAVDLLLGGPPCQGHSALNNHTRGDDPKNELYMRMIRAAEVLECETLLVENVTSVVHDSRNVVSRAVTTLQKLGYEVTTRIVNASEIGVPQLRKRHVLVASKSKHFLENSNLLDVSKPTRSIRWAIADLKKADRRDPMNSVTNLSPSNLKRAKWLIRMRKFDLPNRLRPNCHKDNPGHRYKSMYGRLQWDLPAQTLTTGFRSPGQGRFLHPSRPRVLTCREAARIQFFPDWFDFSPAGSRTSIARSIGNAVPPKIAMHALSAVHAFELNHRNESLTFEDDEQVL